MTMCEMKVMVIFLVILRFDSLPFFIGEFKDRWGHTPLWHFDPDFHERMRKRRLYASMVHGAHVFFTIPMVLL